MRLNQKYFKNAYLAFLPFLLVYVLVVFIFRPSELVGDEQRYIDCALNIIKGYISPPAPNIFLPNGPGYPILIVPFLLLNLPVITLAILNAILYYLSVVFLFKALRSAVSLGMAVLCTLFWAIYFNAFQYLPIAISETFTFFLITLILFFIIKAFKEKNKNLHLIISGILIGYLVLTKVVFGYVILVMLSGSILLWLIQLKSVVLRKTTLILFIALLINVPYLIYTYQLTGKIFYWSTKGGVNLYWMTTPFKGEYGDYEGYLRIADDAVMTIKNSPDNEDSVRSYYSRTYEQIIKYPQSGLEQDSAYMAVALMNIKKHPDKFFLNCLSNIGRILFDFPYSYRLQKPHFLIRLPFNGILVVLILFMIIPTLNNLRKIDFSIQFLLIFILIYLGGSILGSAETRMFTVAVPIILFWLAYMSEKAIKFNIKFKD